MYVCHTHFGASCRRASETLANPGMWPRKRVQITNPRDFHSLKRKDDEGGIKTAYLAGCVVVANFLVINDDFHQCLSNHNELKIAAWRQLKIIGVAMSSCYDATLVTSPAFQLHDKLACVLRCAIQCLLDS